MRKVLDYRIALVAAEWHEEFVRVAVDSCLDELVKLGVAAEHVQRFKVPGSLELPFTAKLLAKSGKWDAVIVFGLIVDGGIYRYEFVAQAVLDGIVRAGMETEVPILSAVLTPHNFAEGDHDYTTFLHSHLSGKGVEAGRSAVSIIGTVRALVI